MFDSLLLTVGAVVLGIILITLVILTAWKKVPADKAAVVTGLGKKKVITAGGVIVIPVLQRIDYISLQNVRFPIAMQDAMTRHGVPINTEGIVVIKVQNTEEAILMAMEQFNDVTSAVTKEKIIDTAKDVSEGKLREIIATLTVEEIYSERDKFASKVLEVAAEQLNVLGLELKSFSIKEISDKNGYLEALGKPQIAGIKRDAQIAEAEALRETQIKTSEAKRLGAAAQLEADAKIAEAQKEADVKVLDYEQQRQLAKAKTDASYEIQQNITNMEVINTEMDAAVLKEERQKSVKEAEIQVEIAAAIKNTELAERKAERTQKELLETVVNPAAAEKQKAELQAEADKIKTVRAAEADAEAKKLNAEAEAAMIQKTGEATAQAIKLRGLAEAEAMEKKAEAYAKYGNAAIIDIVIDKLPEITRAIAEPMSRIDKITIIGGGDGSGGSATDVTKMALGSLTAITEGMRDVLGFDMTEVMKANTYAGKTDKNINFDLDKLSDKEKAAVIAETAGVLKDDILDGETLTEVVIEDPEVSVEIVESVDSIEQISEGSEEN